MTTALGILMGNAPIPSSKGVKTDALNAVNKNFSNLLTNMKQAETSSKREESLDPILEEAKNQLKKLSELLANISEGSGGLSEELLKLLTEDSEKIVEWLNSSETPLSSGEQLLEELQTLIDRLNGEANKEDSHMLQLLEEIINSPLKNEQNKLFSDAFYPVNQNGNGNIGNAERKLDQTALIQQTEQLVNKMGSQALTNRDYKQLLQLLEQWSQLSSVKSSISQSFLGEAQSDKKMHLFQTLLTNYKAKENLQQKYGYANRVSQKDIQNWLMKAMENYEESTKMEASQAKNQVHAQLGQPIDSKVQQFVIHLNQTTNDQTQVQKQLMDQIQQVLSKSNFMKLTNGTNQLTLRLQPEHLGDISVKLTQVNGEMIVKMLVQSQGAKDLLEGNLKQLRHLFSPQQVTIEKLDNIQSSNQETVTEDNQGNQKDSNQASQHGHEDEEQTEDEKIKFHDLLMDAKV